jgi:hypothetical protein
VVDCKLDENYYCRESKLSMLNSMMPTPKSAVHANIWQWTIPKK